MADCKWYQAGCKAKEAVGDAAGQAVKEVAQNWGDGAMAVLKWINTFWMKIHDPDTGSKAIMAIQRDLGWYMAAFAIIGFLFALAKMVMNQDFKTLIGGVAPIVKMIIVTGCYGVGITAVLQAGSEFSTWILDRASGQGDLTALGTAIQPLLGQSPGIALLLALLMFIGSLVNALFMVFRNLMIPIMLALLPTLAASSGTEAGKQAFAKANGWLLAFLLFKPVAGIIYAVGLFMMKEKPMTIGDKSVDTLINVGEGFLVLCLAALALPALIKFLVPVAAQGASGFSGAGALAGAVTVAAGAAVLASGAGAGTGGGGGAAVAPSSGGPGAGGKTPDGSGAVAPSGSGSGGPGSGGASGSGAKGAGPSGGGNGGDQTGGADGGAGAGTGRQSGTSASADGGSSNSQSSPGGGATSAGGSAPAAGGADSDDKAARAQAVAMIAGAAGQAIDNGSDQGDAPPAQPGGAAQ